MAIKISGNTVINARNIQNVGINNWLIEDQIELNFLNQIQKFLDENIKHFPKDKIGYSTIGNNCEQYWIKGGENNFEFSSLVWENINNEIKKIFLKELQNLLKYENLKLNLVSSWTVVGEENTYHKLHDHSGGFDGFSAVIYIRVPQLSGTDSYHSNRINFVMHADPYSKFLVNESPNIISIDPNVGKILIFPRHMIHGTYPQPKGIRQTLNLEYNFDFDSAQTSK